MSCVVVEHSIRLYSGLRTVGPDTLARLSAAMPPQGFGGSQGSEGDYQWSTYEQYGGGGADLRPPYQQYTQMAAAEATAWGLQQHQQPQWYDPYGSSGWYSCSCVGVGIGRAWAAWAARGSSVGR